MQRSPLNAIHFQWNRIMLMYHSYLVLRNNTINFGFIYSSIPHLKICYVNVWLLSVSGRYGSFQWVRINENRSTIQTNGTHFFLVLVLFSSCILWAVIFRTFTPFRPNGNAHLLDIWQTTTITHCPFYFPFHQCIYFWFIIIFRAATCLFKDLMSSMFSCNTRDLLSKHKQFFGLVSFLRFNFGCCF